MHQLIPHGGMDYVYSTCIVRCGCFSGPDGNQESDKIVQMTVNEVFNGKDAEEGHFLGLVPLVEHYLASVDLEVHTKKTLQSYLQFISKKASGKIR